MKNMRKYWNKPITWGDLTKLQIAVMIIYMIVYVPIYICWFQPKWWVKTKEIHSKISSKFKPEVKYE